MTKWSSRYAHVAIRSLVLLSPGLIAGCDEIPSLPSSPGGTTPAELTTTRESALTIGQWSTLGNRTPTTATNTIQLELLSNGSVLLGDGFNSWWTLTPDTTGSYQSGTWTQVASSNYTRTFTPSSMLSDGRFLLAGGEYVLGTNQQNIDIYDPVQNTWTEGPDMPQIIGDAASSILPDGRFYVASVITAETYFLNPNSLTWTQGPTIGTGDFGGEKGWTLLQDGSVLDAFYTGSYFQNGVWTPTAPTGALPNVLASGTEIGPMSLLPSGKVIQFGGSDGVNPPVGNTAIYTPSTHSWAAGPSAPDGLQWADTSAVVMVNGHVLTSTTSAESGTGTAHAIWEYDPTVDAATCVATPSTCFTKIFTAGSDPNGPANLSNPIFLPLPNGQVLVADPYKDPFYHLYTPAGAIAGSRPTLTSLSVPAGGVYTLAGTQLNGLIGGASFGDDRNSATNYPIVGLKDTAGHVYYARSYQFNQMAPLAGASGSCKFVLPPSIPNGSYSVFVSATGVTSSNVLPLNITGAHAMSVTGPTSISLGSAGAITVTISTPAPSGGTFVTLASDNTNVATVPPSVTVPQGSTTATFTLTSNHYGVAHISAFVSNNQFVPAVLEYGWRVNSVYDNGLCGTCGLAVGRNDAKMPTGATSDQWTVNISNTAPSSGVVIGLQSSDTRWATVPATVTVPFGATSVTFQVSRGSQSWGSLANITATVGLTAGAPSKSNSIITINSAKFPQIIPPLSLLM